MRGKSAWRADSERIGEGCEDGEVGGRGGCEDGEVGGSGGCEDGEVGGSGGCEAGGSGCCAAGGSGGCEVEGCRGLWLMSCWTDARIWFLLRPVRGRVGWDWKYEEIEEEEEPDPEEPEVEEPEVEELEDEEMARMNFFPLALLLLFKDFRDFLGFQNSVIKYLVILN